MPSSLAHDVEGEFATLLREADLLARALPRLTGEDAGVDDALRWIEIGGVAATVEKIYSGCERITLLLAKRVDGAPIEGNEGWHAALLSRLANPFPPIRDAILSSDCRRALDRFRSFRHRVRNTYGLDLDVDIVLERAAELAMALERFRREIADFLTAWSGPALEND